MGRQFRYCITSSKDLDDNEAGWKVQFIQKIIRLLEIIIIFLKEHLRVTKLYPLCSNCVKSHMEASWVIMIRMTQMISGTMVKRLQDAIQILRSLRAFRRWNVCAFTYT